MQEFLGGCATNINNNFSKGSSAPLNPPRNHLWHEGVISGCKSHEIHGDSIHEIEIHNDNTCASVGDNSWNS